MSEEKYTLKQYAAMEGGHTLGDENNGLEFIQSLGEARMFKTRQQISSEGARGLTDHLFVGLLSLYAMSNDYKYAPMAKQYARRTGMYGGFNKLENVGGSNTALDTEATIFNISFAF